MSLLGDLWGAAHGASVGGNSRQESGRLEIERKALRQKDISYVQAVSSSSSDDRKKKNDPTMLGDSTISKGKELGENGWILVQHKKRKSTSPTGGISKGRLFAGSKRPWSPGSNVDRYNRCFRSSHTTSECRHQVVCRRCECVGHVAVNCPLDAQRSPRRKKIRVRPRVSTEADKLASEQRLKPQVFALDSTGHSQPTYAKISIPVPPEASKLRDKLESVGILSLRTGQISEKCSPGCHSFCVERPSFETTYTYQRRCLLDSFGHEGRSEGGLFVRSVRAVFQARYVLHVHLSLDD